MATKLDEIISHFSAVTSSSINDEKAAAFCTSRAFEAVEITFNTFCSNEFTRLSLCVVDFNNMYMYMCVSVCVVGGCFQERSLSSVKQMVVGDPLRSIPVYENTCSYILVSGTEFTAVQLSAHFFCNLFAIDLYSTEL